MGMIGTSGCTLTMGHGVATGLPSSPKPWVLQSWTWRCTPLAPFCQSQGTGSSCMSVFTALGASWRWLQHTSIAAMILVLGEQSGYEQDGGAKQRGLLASTVSWSLSIVSLTQ